jgi:hypothetical protein
MRHRTLTLSLALAALAACGGRSDDAAVSDSAARSAPRSTRSRRWTTAAT